MSLRWGWVFAIAVVVLVAVGVFWTPVGALLGGLAALAWAAALLLAHGRVLHERTALVVLRKPGDVAVRVEMRPGWVPLAPWEEAGPCLDTADRLQVVPVDEMVQADLTPLAMGLEVHLVRRLAPLRIPKGTLGQMLPALMEPTLSRVVAQYTDDILRRLVEGDSAGVYGPLQHKRIERRLRRMLQDRLRDMGLLVVELWVVARPMAGLYEALGAAAQQRVAIGLEGQRLDMLLQSLSEKGDPARSLALLELARALATGGNKWVALDLEAWLRQAAAQQPGTPLAQDTPAKQTTGWSGRPPVQ